jgi:hypothetical protein
MTSFLGLEVGGDVGAPMRDRLAIVDRQMRAAFAADPEPRMPVTGEPAIDIAAWCGVRSVGGIRADAGPHTAGVAIDINYDTQPYIVTCSVKPGAAFDDLDKWRLGGEKAARAMVAMRVDACTVYERALKFRGIAPPEPGDHLHARRIGESTGSVYDRFRVVSDALQFYFSFAFRDNFRSARGDRFVRRVVVTDRNADLQASIPESERLPRSIALERLRAYIVTADYQRLHPGAPPGDAEAVLAEMLWYYEWVRTPMIVGTPSPSAPPQVTRSPTFGFLDIRRDLAIALCSPRGGGMRWGACDFGKEEDDPNENGDMMHFDLNTKAVPAGD